MSSIATNDINERIRLKSGFLKLLKCPNFHDKIKELNISWETGDVESNSELYPIFIQEGFINKNEGKLTKNGVLFCGRIAIDLESELLGKDILDNKYHILQKIQIGKNSCTFLAEHITLGKSVVLKFLRPGASENIAQALKLISSYNAPQNLVQPLDFFRVNLNDVFQKKLEIECIVFPYIIGKSLKEYLNNDKIPINAHAIASFIKQVGRVLEYLESKGAYHGDLHDENIIVNFENSGNIVFNVIDVSYGVTGSLNSTVCRENDISFFRQHVWNFLSTQQKFLAKMSIRKYLGSEIFHIVSTVMLPDTKSFKTIVNLFKDNYTQNIYQREKRKFLENKFSPPGNFKLQRYEEITDQTVALKLFVPFPELMKNIRAFSNIVISGNRGSGKSTYLAALAFYPNVTSPYVNFKEIFGIYFPCRQGEFRLLSSDIINYEELGLRRVKHVMVIKIIRRTLEVLAEGIECNRLSDPPDYDNIKKLLSVFMVDGEIISLDKDVVSEIRNLVSIMVRIEMKELDNLFCKKKNIGNRLTTEIDILAFFRTIQECFSELSMTRFHLLFDDAGKPNIPTETQYIINDFITSSNPIYCVKLSTEKYSYEFQTTFKKELENGHDYYEYDLSRLFFIGSGTFGLDPQELEQYFKQIIGKRLEYFEYQSAEIIDYLGDDIKSPEILIHALATGRRNAYYCGWSMVWKIADRIPRNLLELISEIFSVANIDNKTIPEIIPMRSQDRAIRAVSEKRLRSLSQISGIFENAGNRVSLGKRLFEITTVVGSVFRIYLTSEKAKRRKDQYLALERNDFSFLDPVVETLLKEIIKYGIFDESRLEFARDDRVKKPIYMLNRIYCPAFGLGLRRDQHLRLSKEKFEDLFLFPKKFLMDGTKRLRITNTGELPIQKNLFDEINY